MAREESWTHHGLWGKVRSGESSALRDGRAQIESGRLTRRGNQSQLTYIRSYELARQLGMKPEAEAIEGKIRQLQEHEQRLAEGRPEKIPGNGKTMDLYMKRYWHNGERVVCINDKEE